MSTLRCILNIEVYEISENYIRELRDNCQKPEMVFDILPEYTINKNEGANNCLIEANYYLQFVGLFKETTDKKYLLVNLSTADRLLDYEISQSGITDLFKDIDFEKILSVFTPRIDDDIKKHSIPASNYLVVELTYIRSQDYYSGGWECDMEIDIIGYLNGKMEIQYYDESIRT
jgi:hypothetical protein